MRNRYGITNALKLAEVTKDWELLVEDFYRGFIDDYLESILYESRDTHNKPQFNLVQNYVDLNGTRLFLCHYECTSTDFDHPVRKKIMRLYGSVEGKIQLAPIDFFKQDHIFDHKAMPKIEKILKDIESSKGK